jgi:Tfp pilus assembly protein PilN
MINLLPEADQKIIKIEILRRFSLVFGAGLFILIAIQLILLQVFLLSIDSYKKEVKQELSFQKKVMASKNVEESESRLKELNKIATAFKKEEEKINILSSALEKITEIKPDLVKITSFNFDEEKIYVSGLAAARKDLLAFSEKLKSITFFKKIDLPLSNLLNEKNLEFSFVIYLKAKKNEKN